MITSGVNLLTGVIIYISLEPNIASDKEYKYGPGIQNRVGIRVKLYSTTDFGGKITSNDFLTL